MPVLHGSTEPARWTALIVGIITALIAALTVLEAGGSTRAALLAGLGSLLASLGGGEVIRAHVEPVALAEERRDLIARTARGEDVSIEPVDEIRG